jgi:hypothetical protein
MKSLTEQIIELMPEEEKPFRGIAFHAQQCNVAGFNRCRTEMIKVIPEILSLIRGEVEKVGIEDIYWSDDYGKMIPLKNLLDLFNKK